MLVAGTEPADLGALSADPSTPAPGPTVEAELASLVAAQPAAGEPPPRAFIRSEAETELGPLAATAGMRIAETLGPFVDHVGIEHYVDLIPIPNKLNIEGTAGVLALLVIDALPTPPTPGPQKVHVELGAGSLWIALRALVPVMTGECVGLAFSKASVSAVDVTFGPAGSIVLQPGSSLTFELELDRGAAPAGAPSIGGDAAAAVIELPARVTIVFGANGAELSALDPSSATVYGVNVDLSRNAAPLRVEDLGGRYLFVPCDASTASFTVADCVSSDFVVNGTAAITSAGWVLPVANAPPLLLGAAAGAGDLALELATGVTATFGTPSVEHLLTDVAFVMAPAHLQVVAHRGRRGAHTSFPLWAPPPPGSSTATPPPVRRASELTATYPPGGSVSALLVPGREEVVAHCTVTANLDRPLAADGSRLPLNYPQGAARFVDDSTDGAYTILIGRSDPENRLGRVLALENALVATRPSTALLFRGTLEGDWNGGRLALSFPLGGIVPTLPDPYAASFPTPQLIDTGTSGSLVASSEWTPGSAPELSLAHSGTPITVRGGFTLLDLSSNADQFGVTVPTRDKSGLTIASDALAAPAHDVAVYALPGVSWEPVVSDQPPTPAGWQDAFSPDDGPATFMWANTVDLVRIEPRAALPHFSRAARSHMVGGQFTLPFGLTAYLSAEADLAADQRPTFDLRRADYASGLSDGLQLSIVANPNSTMPPALGGGTPFDGPALPGYTTTGSPAATPDQNVYGIQVLGWGSLDAGSFFDQQFSVDGAYPGIPVTRIDLSGYGTSMFSDWHHGDIKKVGVVRTRFEVLVGRTAYELLVLQSVIAPWSIRITRTIIFDRYDSGLVVKHDSGWKPAGIGKFELLSPSQVIPGALQSLDNIANIAVGTGALVSVKGPDSPRGTDIEFVPVTFDADARLDTSLVSVSVHGETNIPAAATQVVGYAQRTVGDTAYPDEVLALMDAVGAAGVSGGLGCIVGVGAAGAAAQQFTLNVSSLAAAATSERASGKTYAAAVAVALNGTPRLPRDGAWSVARRPSSAQTPTAVDSSTPIPLVRARSAAGDQWRLLDPSDAATAGAPATYYGVLQGVGSAKTLFEHVVIGDNGGALNIDPAHLPKLADLGALLGATDVFPDLGVVLAIDQPSPLELAADGFKQTYDKEVTQADRTVFELGIVKIVMSYSAPDANGTVKNTSVTLTLDPAASPRWRLDIQRISFKVLVSGFGSDPLLTFYGGFHASETEKPTVDGVQVEYGSALSFVKDVFSGLGPLIEAVGGDVDLDVAFAATRLTVRDYLAVPQIPLGFGDIHDVVVELGFDAQIPADASFHVGLGSKDKPFTWLVSPLSGTGAIALGVAKGELDVYVEAGIGVGLEIDVAVASGGASITLDLAITIAGSDISVTIGLLGQAEVSVLGGVASASLTLAASITLTPKPPPPAFPPDDIDLSAAVAVGIHISICWVVNIDFDGSWQFSQEIPVHL